MLRADRGVGRLKSFRIEQRDVRGLRLGEKFRVPDVPLVHDLAVELELERFEVTRRDTRFVIGRKDAPDEPLDFDPSQVGLYRVRVVGHPGSSVVLALPQRRKGH